MSAPVRDVEHVATRVPRAMLITRARVRRAVDERYFTMRRARCSRDTFYSDDIVADDGAMMMAMRIYDAPCRAAPR